jgi:WD40 repeat protein
MINFIILLCVLVPDAVEVYSTDIEGRSYVEEIVSHYPQKNLTSPQQMPGWPQNMGAHPNYGPSGVSLADVNEDGFLEILAGSTNGTFHVWDYQGNELPGWPKSGLDMIQTKAAVADIDTSYPGMEIIIPNRQNILYAWHNDGTDVTGWPQVVGETGGFKSPVIFDLDGDGDLEIILGQRLYPNGRVLVFHHDGSACAGWPQSVDYMVVATPSVGDVESDGVMEVCALSYYSAYLWDRDGNLKPGWPKLNVMGGSSYAQPVLCDLDEDNDLEILCSYYTNWQNYVGIYHHDGNNFSSWPQIYTGPQTYTTPVTGDIDADDDFEIFGGGHVMAGPSLLARHHTGAQVTGWPVVVANLECSPIVFDINDDGEREVIVADNLNPGNCYAYKGTGALVPDWPIATTGAAIVNSVSVGDVDADGDIELALVTVDGVVNLWTIDNVSYRSYLTDWGTFFHDMWNTGWFHPQSPQNVVATGYSDHIALSWDAATESDVAGYNVYRSEVSGGPYSKINDSIVAGLDCDDFTASPGITYYYSITAQIIAGTESRLSEEVSSMLGIEEYGLHPVSSDIFDPNPFKQQLEIRLPNEGDFCVKFYDSKGAFVGELQGFETVVWSPGKHLPAGVYFMEISTETSKTLHKVVRIE